MAFYKILRRPEWEAFSAAGRFEGSPDDLRDGFVHLSTREQVEGTLQRHFPGEAGLVLLTLDRARLLPSLRMEPSRGGEPFPHLYRPLQAEDVVLVQDLAVEGGRHAVPSP